MVPQILHYPGIIPTDDQYTMAERQSDPLDEKIRAFLQRPYKIGQVSAKFSGLRRLTDDMRPVKMDFPDDSLIGRPGITMMKLTTGECVQLGRVVLTMMASGFIRQGAAALFTLAYNLKAPGRNHSVDIFDDVGDLESLGDKNYSDFSDKVLVHAGVVELILPSGNEVSETVTYVYVAASTMRLFTKSPSNYIRAWSHIKSGFTKFYGEDMKVQLLAPTETSMKSLADWFSLEPKAKQTLYRLLYLGSSNKKHEGFKRFLYEIHLANTGMHLASMFVQLCRILTCNSGILLQAINVKEYERPVICLIALLKLLHGDSPSHQRRMWKYGRIFDETFMAGIQTKACPKLVYVFAEALRKEAPQTYGDVLKIAQLAHVGEANRRKCKDIATNLVQAIRNETNSSDNGENCAVTVETSTSWN